MSKYTPGPWTYNPDDGSLTSDRNFIGRFHCGWDGRPVKADARLITAAPELLQACKAVLRIPSGGVVTHEIRGQLAAAVAKAVGK